MKIQPVVYLSKALDSNTFAYFSANLAETGPYPETVFRVAYEASAHELAQLLVDDLEDHCPGVQLFQIQDLGRNKAFREIALHQAMTKPPIPWLYLEPGLVQFGEGWLPKLEEEYRTQILESGLPNDVLGAQGIDPKGEISPLIAVYPAHFWNLSTMVKYPDKAPEQELRWELKKLLRPSTLISCATGTPIRAKVGA